MKLQRGEIWTSQDPKSHVTRQYFLSTVSLNFRFQSSSPYLSLYPLPCAPHTPFRLYTYFFSFQWLTSTALCLFRAIVDQLCGDQSKHHEFRNQITSYMIEHKDHFELFVEDDEPFDDYMDRMKTHGEWGGNQELYAASQALQVDITIYQLDAPCYSLKGSDTGKLQNISLSYHGECHYNSVRTVDVGETASLRIENTTTKVSTTLTPSEQTVANALNWAKVDDIKLALELMNDDTDEAIDFLCINMYNMNSISSRCDCKYDYPVSNRFISSQCNIPFNKFSSYHMLVSISVQTITWLHPPPPWDNSMVPSQ